jgi:hypothetical protein
MASDRPACIIFTIATSVWEHEAMIECHESEYQPCDTLRYKNGVNSANEKSKKI